MPILVNDPNAKDIIFRNMLKNFEWRDTPDSHRIHVEELFEISKNCLDKKFSEQIKHDFSACYAELYFTGVFIDRLSLNPSHPSDEGPDLFIEDLDCWVEITKATDGHKNNRNCINQPENGEVRSYSEEQVILRLTGAFTTKAKKALNDIDKGLIKNNQPIIICINGGEMYERLPMYAEGSYPPIVKSVLPVGDMILWVGTESKTITNVEHKYRGHVNKKLENGDTSPIKTDYFLDEEYTHISAVIYSYMNAWNPITRAEWGDDFIIIHNPLAKNPLSPGAISCGEEYLVSATDSSFTLSPAIKHTKRDNGSE